MGMMKAPALLLTLLLTLTACSETQEPSASQPAPDSPVSTVLPPGPVEPLEPSPSPVEPTPGLENVHPVKWDEAVVSDDGRTATLTFYTGVPECYGLDRVDVEYLMFDASRPNMKPQIIITLFEGTVPGAQACIEIALYASTTVTLDVPANGYRIVDGAEKGSTTP
jgi:hypothetical protein